MVIFSKLIYFDGFIFEVGIHFEVFEAVLHQLIKHEDITKLSTVEQHYNYPCSVMLILEITCSRILVTARNSQSILAFRTNYNKTVCLLMALAIDSVVPGCRIYKDVWSAEMTLLCRVCNREGWYAITHACSDSLKFSRDTVNFCCGIDFRRKAVHRNLFSKKKAFSKYPKINSLRN